MAMANTATSATPGYDSRNDSFYVQHYSIYMDLSDLSTSQIKGECRVSFISKINGLNKLRLELFKLKVDSVKDKNGILSYNYNDSILAISYAKAFAMNDTGSLLVYYHGKTYTEQPGGFGGFTFSTADGGYAYNLGIGLHTLPHNLGRAWFPCVDNFGDKASFDFTIKTPYTHKAFCNGLLTDSSVTKDNKRLWKWDMKQIIPPYLASVGVGQYQTLRMSYKGLKGIKPIQIGLYATDTAIARVCFENLPKTMNIYEKCYGPYGFDRVGYVNVPFSGGAMEHAGNITFPRVFVSYGKTYETLWAHELAHQWWGDLMTCASAEDMWLNEGWASYTESLFKEQLYGHAAYVSYARNNHYDVLRSAYLTDNGYRAISPMPQQYTYGPHIYFKGADAVHTLRTYLGDSLFFKGIKGFLSDYAYKTASSYDFMNALKKYTSKDMSSFFKTWIFNPGFPHVELAGYTISQSGSNYTLNNIKLIQKTKEAPYKSDSIPMTLTVMDANWKRYDKILYSSDVDNYSWTLPAEPKFIGLNIDGQIAEATTSEYHVFKDAPATYSFASCLMNVSTTAKMSDSAWLYIEHHWIGPERTANTPHNIRLSSERYWVVDGILPADFAAKATIVYDGRQTTDFNTGYMDVKLLTKKSEDSIKLMYRPSADKDWVEYDNYQKTIGSATDLFGNITINNLRKGQYVLAIQDHTASIKAPEVKTEGILLYPNPARNNLTVRFNQPELIKYIRMTDMSGKEVYRSEISGNKDSIDISVRLMPQGTYFVMAYLSDQVITQKVVVKH